MRVTANEKGKLKSGVSKLALVFLCLALSCESKSQRPSGFPDVPVPGNNSMTAAKVALGRRLFFEPNLSADGKVSCASCHKPDHAFADQVPFSTGINGQSGVRNSISILNAAYAPVLLWDGSASTLEEQVRYPVRHPKEMNMTERKVVEALSYLPAYRPLFVDAFGEETITFERVSQAIASFERTLISKDSPFDRFYFTRDQTALSDSARRGWQLFKGKANCIICHQFDESHPFFTDFKFHNTGIGFDKDQPDWGHWVVTKQKADKGRFKTPSLRNVALTSPYMHDGRFNTLAEVIEFYQKGCIQNRFLDDHIHPLPLSPEEKEDMIQFLQSLTGEPP